MAIAGAARVFWVLATIHCVAAEIHVPNDIQNSIYNYLEEINNTLGKFQNTLLTDLTVLDFTGSAATKPRFWSHHQPTTWYTNSSKVRYPLGNTTIGRVLPSKHYNVHRNSYLLRVTSSTFKEIAQFISKVNSYGYPHRDYFTFVGNSDIVKQALELEACRSIKYKLELNGKAIFGPENTSASQALKKINLNGRKFRVLGPHLPLYLTLHKNGTISGGTHYMVLTTIANKYNFSVDIDPTARGTGIKLKNGTWTGTTGGVYYRKYDIGLLVSSNLARFAVIDIAFIQRDAVQFITKCPEVRTHFASLFFPFQPAVWAFFLLSFFATAAMGYLLLQRSSSRDKGYYAVFIPYQIALDQGFQISLPKGMTFISTIWMFSMVVITTSYRSDLIRYFSFPSLAEVPEDVYDLDRMKHYTINLHYTGGTAFQYLEGATNGVVKRIRQRIQLQPDAEKCLLSAVNEADTVCISWDMLSRPHIAKNLTVLGGSAPCIITSRPIVAFPGGFAFQKNSIYTEAFAFATGWMAGSGLAEKWNSDVAQNYTEIGKEWIKSQRHGSESHEAQKPTESPTTQKGFLKLQHVAVIFVVMAGSEWLALMVCLWEVGWAKRCHGLNETLASIRRVFLPGTQISAA